MSRAGCARSTRHTSTMAPTESVITCQHDCITTRAPWMSAAKTLPRLHSGLRKFTSVPAQRATAHVCTIARHNCQVSGYL